MPSKESFTTLYRCDAIRLMPSRGWGKSKAKTVLPFSDDFSIVSASDMASYPWGRTAVRWYWHNRSGLGYHVPVKDIPLSLITSRSCCRPAASLKTPSYLMTSKPVRSGSIRATGPSAATFISWSSIVARISFRLPMSSFSPCPRATGILANPLIVEAWTSKETSRV